jgi:hypothetical protein
MPLLSTQFLSTSVSDVVAIAEPAVGQKRRSRPYSHQGLVDHSLPA